ncbi:hypothetical protein [Halobaculum sp. P14]
MTAPSSSSVTAPRPYSTSEKPGGPTDAASNVTGNSSRLNVSGPSTTTR